MNCGLKSVNVNSRTLFGLALCAGGMGFAIFSFAATPLSGKLGSAGPNGNWPVIDASSAGRVHRGLYRGKSVTYIIKGGKAIFQGDIILEKVDPIDSRGRLRSVSPDSVGIDYSQYLWPMVGNQHQVPYIISAGSGNLTNLNAAIIQFNNTFPNIQFISRTTETDYVNFYFDPNDNSAQCEATVGRAGGEQHVGGSGGPFNPCTVGTILHEMGHTIGLWHEQSRPDRDTFISVNYSNLIKGSISNFNQLYDNALQTTLFDYASIMQYPPFAFSRNGGPAIESIPAGILLSNYTGYTPADIDGIERIYGNPPTAVTVTSNPAGLHVIVDGVTITTPQVFNWALNSVHGLDIPPGVQSQSGYIRNSTEPTTFYYTYGRWNDSPSAAHNITIVPGNGDPATPTTSPAVTTYSANFIQLVPYAATVYPSGTGTVTPSPAPQHYPGSPLLFYTARQQVTLTAVPNAGQNFYEFNNAPFWLPGGLGANPKTFYVPDTGLTVNTTAEFSPNPVYTVTVAPNAFGSNLYVYADGVFSYAPKNFSAFYDAGWTAGSNHTLSVDSPEYPYSSGSRYAFDNWSDGGMTATHEIILPSNSTIYTANLTGQFYVTDYVNETCAGAIDVTPGSPTGDGFYPSGTELTFTETPDPGWLFTGWQYDLSGTSNSLPLTVTDEVLVAADYNTIATPLTLANLSPPRAVAGGGGFTLALNGTGFTPNSVVSVNGTFPAVTFISSTQLTVPVTAGQISTAGAFQVWVENYPGGAPCAAFAAVPFIVADSSTPLQLTSVVSELTHGSAGTFDIDMPLSGTPGVENRSSSAYNALFTFDGPVTSGEVTVLSGTATVGATTFSDNKMRAILTGVNDVQTVVLHTQNINGDGLPHGDVSLSFLTGDVNGNRRVDTPDINQLNADRGHLVDGTNFRDDINHNGRVDRPDITAVRANRGHHLP